MDETVIIQKIEEKIVEYENNICHLQKTIEILKGQSIEGVTPKIVKAKKDDKPTPKKNKKIERKQSGKTIEKGIRLTEKSGGGFVYQVQIYDRRNKCLAYGGTFDDLDVARKQRDKMRNETNSIKPSSHKSHEQSEYGWRCNDCEKLYEQRLKPIICEACNSMVFRKERKNESKP